MGTVRFSVVGAHRWRWAVFAAGCLSLVILIAVSFRTARSRDQRAIAERLERAGFEVAVQSYGAPWLAPYLRVRDEVVYLRVTNARLSSAILKDIGALSGLLRLELDNVRIDGQGIESLRQLRRLEHLSVKNSVLPPRALENLAG